MCICVFVCIICWIKYTVAYLFVCVYGGVLIKVSRSVWFHFRSLFNPVEDIGIGYTFHGCEVARLDAVECKIYFIGSKLMPIQNNCINIKNKAIKCRIEITTKLLIVIVHA